MVQRPVEVTIHSNMGCIPISRSIGSQDLFASIIIKPVTNYLTFMLLVKCEWFSLVLNRSET